MLTSRQQIILRASVEEYIRSRQPVGSKYLLEVYGLPYSSATVRNDMAALEELGYLEKAHVSSGRVPSEKGYRFYVDNRDQLQVEQEVKNRLSVIFSDRRKALSEVIQESCEILSELTQLTIVSLDDPSLNKLQRITLVPLDDRRVSAIIVTNRGNVQNKIFDVKEEISVDDLENCVNVLNECLIDVPIANLLDSLMDIKPILEHKISRHDLLFTAFMEAFSKFVKASVTVSGKSNILYQPEFSDVEKIRKLMYVLEQEESWKFFGNDKELTVNIGSENNSIIDTNDLSIVSKTFSGDSQTAQIAIVGPVRMEYNKVIALLDYITTKIETWMK